MIVEPRASVPAVSVAVPFVVLNAVVVPRVNVRLPFVRTRFPPWTDVVVPAIVTEAVGPTVALPTVRLPVNVELVAFIVTVAVAPVRMLVP